MRSLAQYNSSISEVPALNLVPVPISQPRMALLDPVDLCLEQRLAQMQIQTLVDMAIRLHDVLHKNLQPIASLADA